jgi:hypothetical protein
MRSDSLGLWWRDEPVVKKLKEPKPKRTPPEPTWLRPDYLPGLADALKFDVPIMSDPDLAEARIRGDRLIFDVEAYWNYFLVSFTSFTTGAVTYFEMAPGYEFKRHQLQKLEWILRNFTVVGFNSWSYDIPMVTLALNGCNCAEIKTATNRIIVEEWRPQDVLKQFKASRLKGIDHIDLIEVAPLSASLKIYGGRLHAPRMQDLPFHPETHLSPDQMAIVRWYNINDLTQTGFLMQALLEQLELRENLGSLYDVDLRSKSDAQIAEAVISHEIERITGARPTKPVIEPGTCYWYHVPQFIQFESPLMKWALDVVRNARFVVAHHGSIEEPPEISSLHLQIGSNVYRMGIGGLHSSESTVAYKASDDFYIVDRDVTSYYPQIILNLGLFPKHLGEVFLRVYNELVQRRIEAKQNLLKVIADCLKIVVNGSFGKLGSKWSILYSPDLLMRVTLTGQLCLLMLIERLELRGIRVASANTDGVVILCPKDRYTEMESIFKQWERDTGFVTEETRYLAYYSRDVNNYIAVKAKQDKQTKKWLNVPDGVKSKGAYNNPWNDPKQALFRMHKNPTNTVCLDAIELLLTKNIPVAETIRGCTDVRKFVTVRKVKGGAVKDGEYLGASIRWYYATGQSSEMVYAASGNKVPRSDGAKPLMQLPQQLPDDIDYEWYVAEANKILQEIGYAA